MLPRRERPFRPAGSLPRLGASRRVPSLIDCLVGGRVRRLFGGYVLRGKVFRSGVLLHVRVRAWGSPPAITVAQPVAPCEDISRARLSFPRRFTSISRTEYNQLTIDTAIVDTFLARHASSQPEEEA